MKHDRILRREKRDPDSDALHVMRVGVAVLLLFVLPGLIVAHQVVVPQPERITQERTD